MLDTDHNVSFDVVKKLSPRRNSTSAESLSDLVDEQMDHFGIDPNSDYGRVLSAITKRLYENQEDIERLWQITLESMQNLPPADRILRFNAKKFLSFQIAKLLDTLQNAFRGSYQALNFGQATQAAKGPYPVFDNITGIFSATPVITRTATYIYACAEWIEDAFSGKEMMLEIYSRLLNPTSVSLANYIVDLEAGPYAGQYLAWNFNSGMAAIDSTLANILGRDDILITSRNIYGGAHQLIYDWYGKPSNLNIKVETFDGYDQASFEKCLEETKEKHKELLSQGRKIYVYLESPCNPHGYVLDVPGICGKAHQEGLKVVLDATVATPFLYRPLQHEDESKRPDFVIHSYTKDLSGTGSVIAGCVIGKNEDMFIPKGSSAGDLSWDQSMFWNVYYVKGAFLNADAAFEVMQGMRTLTVRMMQKCINTKILAEFLDHHPMINVRCNFLKNSDNHQLAMDHLYLGIPAPLFTIDMGSIPRPAFQRFFDSLSPTFGHMISLGQSNTIVSCPALTTHSELDEEALAGCGLSPTTVRMAIGDEDPMDLIGHFIASSQAMLDPTIEGFSDGFMNSDQIRELVRHHYTTTHQDYVNDLTK